MATGQVRATSSIETTDYHEDTKDTKRSNNGSEHDASNPLFKDGHVEIYDKGNSQTSCPQVAHGLRDVYRMNPIHGLHLENERAIDNQIDALSR